MIYNNLTYPAGLEVLLLNQKWQRKITPPHSLSAETPTHNVVSTGGQKHQKHWFVMRDLKRPNAKLPAYKMLEDKCFEVFIPTKWQVVTKLGKRVREKVPVINGLLFVHSERTLLDPIVELNSTLQYYYRKGGGYREPMVVRDDDMDKFISAVNSSQNSVFYSPQEITPDMIGSKVHIIGGNLDGYDVSLLKIKGSRKKRIFVELPGIIVVSVEIEPEFIQLI